MRAGLMLLLGLAAPLVVAEPLPLAQLLNEVNDSPVMQAATERLQALHAEQSLRETEQGWSLFASGSAGSYRDLDSEGGQEQIDDYLGRNYQVGVSYPLLGSLQRRLDALQASEQQVQRQQLQIALQRAKQRLTVRTAYADWWRAEQELHWCAGMSSAAVAAQERLLQRQQSGWLRTSQAQSLRNDWQALSRQCAQAPEQVEEARRLLGMLVSVPASAEAVSDALVAAPRPASEWQALLQRHPRMAERAEQVRYAEQLRDSAWYDSVESSFKLAQSLEDRNDYNKNGSGLVASLDFSAPFDLLGNGRARQQLSEANYQVAQAQLQAEQQALEIALARSLRSLRSSTLELQQRLEQLPLLATALQERQARRNVDAEDALLGELVDARNYYQVGLAQIAAWHTLWLREAELRMFADDDSGFAALLGEQRLNWSATTLGAVGLGQGSKAGAWSQATYVWHSQGLLDPRQRTQQLKALQDAGMQGIYLGLNAQQLRQLPATRANLKALLDAAATHNIRVSLLLGDPHWITPAGRGDLLRVLEQLQGLPFASLHLDLEVEQLAWPVPEQHLRDWLDSLRAAAKASAWPLEISSHPRWFEPPLSKVCVPCELPQIGVSSVSLMLYSRNPERNSQRMQAMAKRWPELHLRLAQSVEPSLAGDESWAGSSRRELRKQHDTWRAALQAQGVKGLDWQAWQYFPQ